MQFDSLLDKIMYLRNVYLFRRLYCQIKLKWCILTHEFFKTFVVERKLPYRYMYKVVYVIYYIKNITVKSD